MTRNNILDRVDTLNNILSHSKMLNGFPGGWSYTIPLGYITNKSIGINSKGVKLINTLIKDILKDKSISKYCSTKYTKERIIDIIKSFITKPTEINQQTITDLIITLRKMKDEHMVCFLLSGIKVKSRISFGPVDVYCVNKELSDSMVKRIKAPMSDLLCFSKEDALKNKHSFVGGDAWGSSCAVTYIKGDYELSKSEAYSMINELLSILTFYIAIIYGLDSYMKAEFYGKNSVNITSSLAINTTKTLLNESSSPMDRFTNVELTSKLLDEFRSYKFNEVIKLYSKKYSSRKLSKFQDRLLSAVVWVGKSFRDNDIVSSFLSTTTATELIFARYDNESITNSIAEGIAFLLSEDKKERIVIKHKIKILYGKRCSISHRGKINIEKNELISNQRYAINALLRLIDFKETFKDAEDLFKWIDNQKFS